MKIAFKITVLRKGYGQFGIVGMFIVNELSIKFDISSIDKSEISTSYDCSDFLENDILIIQKYLQCSKTFDENENFDDWIFYCGIIDGIEKDDNNQFKIYVLPPHKIMDVKMPVVFNTSQKTMSRFYYFLKLAYLNGTFSNSIDMYSISDDGVSNYTRELETVNLYDLFLELFKINQMSYDFGFVSCSPYFNPSYVEDKDVVINLNADYINCLKKNVVFTQQTAPNVVIVYNKNNYTEDERVIGVRTDNGTIRIYGDDKSGMSYFNVENDIIDNYTADSAATKEVQMLQKYSYNHLVELTYCIDDSVVDFYKYKNYIGRKFKIKVDGVYYYSMLTGWELDGDVVKYLFGFGRAELTKKIAR